MIYYTKTSAELKTSGLPAVIASGCLFCWTARAAGPLPEMSSSSSTNAALGMPLPSFLPMFCWLYVKWINLRWSKYYTITSNSESGMNITNESRAFYMSTPQPIKFGIRNPDSTSASSTTSNGSSFRIAIRKNQKFKPQNRVTMIRYYVSGTLRTSWWG